MKFGRGVSVDAAEDIFEIFQHIDVHNATGLHQTHQDSTAQELFTSSEAGDRHLAILRSFATTCKENKVNPSRRHRHSFVPSMTIRSIDSSMGLAGRSLSWIPSGQVIPDRMGYAWDL